VKGDGRKGKGEERKVKRRCFVTIQACLEGKTILGKTINAFSPFKVQSLQKKSKNFHAKTQSRKGTAKKSFAGSLRLRVFACAFDFLFGCAGKVAARWDNCFALNGFALISWLSTAAE